MEHKSSSYTPQTMQVMEDIHQLWFVFALKAAVDFDFAGIIGDGEKTTQELAELTGTQEDWVFRVLRALATRGYFEPVEREIRTFRNSNFSQVLREDHSPSLHATAQILLGERAIDQWRALPKTMKTGTPASEIVLGMPTYLYFEQNPEERRVFTQAMFNTAPLMNKAIVEAFNFSAYHHIVDAGGADGSLLQEILQRYPGLSGTLFELPEAAKQLAQTSHAFNVVEGDFFKELPAADLYLFKHILHNWSDQECRDILQSCFRANQHAAVLVCQQVIGIGKNLAEWADLLMGIEQNGRERTLQEYTALFEEAGYHVSKVIPTRSSRTLLLAEVQL